jgi:8-oxo-dGTP pyrophosphatase MutT (NUDIX family)
MELFNGIVNRIKTNLKLELPGAKAQDRMAPATRSTGLYSTAPNVATLQSAVLISLIPKDDTVNTVLIKRTVYRGAHSGQVSFPGGKQEQSDVSLIHTALREAQEEIGIIPSSVELLGTLTPLFIPVSNLIVLPVVGCIASPKKFHLNLHEVEYTIMANLMDFKNDDYKSVRTICINNKPISAPYYKVGKEVVWGATAMIISELTELY